MPNCFLLTFLNGHLHFIPVALNHLGQATEYDFDTTEYFSYVSHTF